MYIDVNKSMFRDAFVRMDRKDNFSYEGLGALYDFLIECEDLPENEMELDVIALCCDFTEYANLEDFNKEHDTANDIEDIEDRTTVIRIDDESFIIQNY
jgi:hypothetical protein